MKHTHTPIYLPVSCAEQHADTSNSWWCGVFNILEYVNTFMPKDRQWLSSSLVPMCASVTMWKKKNAHRNAHRCQLGNSFQSLSKSCNDPEMLHCWLCRVLVWYGRLISNLSHFLKQSACILQKALSRWALEWSSSALESGLHILSCRSLVAV